MLAKQVRHPVPIVVSSELGLMCCHIHAERGMLLKENTKYQRNNSSEIGSGGKCNDHTKNDPRALFLVDRKQTCNLASSKRPHPPPPPPPPFIGHAAPFFFF